MEGRGFSDLLRNTSEEIFLKTMMENPIGITAPSMEMLGFKNISQSFRGDSEELFTSWLSNGDIPSYSSSAVAHRTRQASRRLSTDITSSQQNGVSFQKKGSDDNAPTINLNTIDEDSNDLGLDSLRNAAEKEMQASNLYLAKAWFHSSQPMTRSRSSELRRRYAAMQSSQLSGIPQAPNNIPAHGTNKMQLDFSNANDYHNIQSNQMHSFMSPSNSSTSFNATPVGAADTVSSVVSMLRGTLERKKLNSINEKEKMEGSSYDMLCSHEAVPSTSHNQGLSSQVVGPTTSLHIGSAGPVNLARAEKPLELNMEGFPTWANQAQIGAASQEPSQSESSTAAPALSTGFEVCDGPTYSGHTMSNGVSSSRHVGNDTSNQELKANDYRDRVFGNSFKDERKKPNLVRMGSLTSTASDDKADPTKKRRVERSRKMAEAKEKYSTPPIPSNMQSVLKRCENLEKEVRSLKLNLSFMNRKDSEQTKQIEELQKQKDELVNEKERLLEDIERIVSDSGNM